MFQRRADEGGKEWMRFERFGFKFRVELAAKKPRMIRGVDDFNVIFIRSAPGDAQARGDQRFLVIAVEFVAVAVALADLECAVSLVRERAWLQPAGPGAQSHRAAHLVDPEQFTQLVDHAVRRLRVKFRAVRLLQSRDIARIFDGCALHPQTNSKEGYLVLARVLDGVYHALNAALAESAGNQDSIIAVQAL